MEYRYLGRSGLQVSVVGLGTNNFGWKADGEQADAIVHKALDLGVNFFDTSDSYGRGASEEFLGKALKGARRDAVIATKFSSPMGEGPHWGGGSRRYVYDAVHDSLRRLGTDYIDLYQYHFPDPSTPIEETLRALDDLVRSGEVRYIGHSNFTAAQAVEAALAARQEHLTPFISAQNLFNVMTRSMPSQYPLRNRALDDELAEVCRRYDVGIIPYSPLSSGFLTGKYQHGRPPPEGARLSGRFGSNTLTEQNFATLEKLEAVAEGAGRTMLDLAMSWLVQRPAVASVIAGATSPAQVEANVNAADWTISADELAAIDAATLPG
jgi:aryl-alcohol dehydrogenase-like predicted oxidoreductase